MNTVTAHIGDVKHYSVSPDDMVLIAFYTVFCLYILVEYLRCRRYCDWLFRHTDENETVEGTVAQVWSRLFRSRLTARFITLNGLKVYADVSLDIPFRLFDELTQDDKIEVTYRRSQPELVYLEPYGQRKMKGVRRGLTILPLVFLTVSTAIVWFRFLS